MLFLHSLHSQGTEDGCPSFTPDHVVACPGDEVVFNCTVLDTAGSQTTIWSANLTTGDISCVIIHALGLNDVTVCAPNNITTYLVEVDNTCYTSVLQLTVTQDMHNVVVQCSSPTVQNVIGSGTLLLVDGKLLMFVFTLSNTFLVQLIHACLSAV